MMNDSNVTKTIKQGVGALFSILVCYLHPAKLVSDRYTNKYKRDFLSGVIITKVEVIRVTRREKLYIS